MSASSRVSPSLNSSIVNGAWSRAASARRQVFAGYASLPACVFRRRRVSTGSASPPFRRATSRSFSNRGSRIWRRPRQYYCSGLLLWVIPAPARPTPVWRSASRPVPFGELRSGVPVSVFTAAGLVHQLREARERLLKLQVQLAAVKRLIIDERGYVPLLSSSKGTDRRGNAFRDLPPAS
jgi:hypothetical protein